jgi:hypothetical protein
VAEATSEQISNPDEANPDWRQGYGYQFWMSRHGYRGDGAFGQFCVILPEQDTVIVTTACTIDMQAVLDAMWAHLLPGLGTISPGAGSARDQLSARLARLELPACPAAPAPADWGPWTSGPFTIAASTAGTQVQPFLTAIEVTPRAGGWQISLIEPDNALTLPVGARAWTVSDHADRHGETIPGGRLRWLARRPHPASRGHLPGNPAPDGHYLLPPRTHRRGRVAPPTAHPKQAPAPALPPLGAPCARPGHSRMRWQFIHERPRDSRQMSAARKPCLPVLVEAILQN